MMKKVKPAKHMKEIDRLLDKSWKYHQEALEGMEKVKLAMELSELELEAAMQISEESAHTDRASQKRA